MTTKEVREELTKLIKLITDRGLSLDTFKERGARWELDARDRGILSRIRNLEFLARGNGE
ncbi:hypothetical protein [Nocardia arizonensis]|uniref:hypothetical protein n=1 Tax=Nocardia arizonensis TaxID=1141647 RepID=UPI0006D25D9E|nr:hypothetical protein [Nocardia arizonensis]